jgi:phenylpyruvate tautomerase PptA (4-oxalocrotonate tautomerase family)
VWSDSAALAAKVWFFFEEMIMPIVVFHLPDTDAVQQGREHLTTRACEIFAGVLNAPVERVRAYIRRFDLEDAAAGGVWMAAGGPQAPFYQFFVLGDRPPSHVQALHKAFTDLLVEALNVPRGDIRGVCSRIDPSDWAIAGVTADMARKDEQASRSGQ